MTGPAHPVPLPARLAFTAWMLVWVPIIVVRAGPQNFWWLCNVALFLVLWASWRPNRLLVSSQAGTVVLVGLAWTLDLAAGLVLGASPTGITAYMFDPGFPTIRRFASIYHLWFPVYVLWLCRQLGYDRRGPWLQSLIGSAAIAGGWLFGAPERNLNYSHAPFGIEQTLLPGALYVPLLCLATALLVYWPGHLLVRWLLGRLPAPAAAS